MEIYVTLLIQVALVVHVLKTGRSRYWILVLIFIPLVGALAYVLIEILPEFRTSIAGQRAARGIRRAVDPGGEVRRQAAAWEQSPNADNARRYAEALLGSGQPHELEKATETDHDLPVERVGLRQPAPQVTKYPGLVVADQLDQPWLSVVRVGGENRELEGFEPGVLRRAGGVPGQLRGVRCPRCDKAAGGGTDGNQRSTGGEEEGSAVHGGIPHFSSTSNYIIQR